MHAIACQSHSGCVIAVIPCDMWARRMQEMWAITEPDVICYMGRVTEFGTTPGDINPQTRKTTHSNSVKVLQFSGKTTDLATLLVGVALDSNMTSALWVLTFSCLFGKREDNNLFLRFLLSGSIDKNKKKDSPFTCIGSQVLLKARFASGEGINIEKKCLSAKQTINETLFQFLSLLYLSTYPFTSFFFLCFRHE